MSLRSQARASLTARAEQAITARAHRIVALTIAAGLALTLLLNAADSLEPAYQNRALHAAKETAAAIVLLLVAALLVGRFRRSGRLLDLLALAGVVVLACKSRIFSVLTAVLIETSAASPAGGRPASGCWARRCSRRPPSRPSASSRTGAAPSR